MGFPKAYGTYLFGISCLFCLARDSSHVAFLHSSILSLAVLLNLPAWIVACQFFIKATLVTNFYTAQNYCSTALDSDEVSMLSYFFAGSQDGKYNKCTDMFG